MYRKASALVVLLLVSVVNVWSVQWSWAPASASSEPGDTAGIVFRPVEDGDKPAEYTPDGEGWIWLKAAPDIPGEAPSFVFDAPELAWTAWWNDRELGSSGRPPVFWSPSTAMPVRTGLSAGSGQGILLVKMFVHRGYEEFPAIKWSTDSRISRDASYISSAAGYAAPYLILAFALLLFIGGFFATVTRRLPWDGAMMLFGFFAVLTHAGAVLAFIPGIPRLASWSVVSTISAFSAPLMLTSWRRSVSSAGRKDPAVLSIIDIVLALAVGFWSALPFLSLDLSGLREISTFLLSNNPLPWYALWSAAWAFALWISRTIGRRGGRFGSLMVFLAALAPVALAAARGLSPSDLAGTFLLFGMLASLVVSLPVIMARRSEPRAADAVIPATGDETGTDDAEEVEELEELDEFEALDEPAAPVEEILSAPSPADFTAPADIHEDDENLVRSLRSSMYPDSIPWDPEWSLASTRQGSLHPATGFHDLYTDKEGHLSGFSFMDAGSDSLESLFYAHLARSEFNRFSASAESLPGIARTVHRKTSAAAATAGRVMRGVLVRLGQDRLTFLPMGNPPILLRKADGSIVVLPHEGQAGVNPPLGTVGFGQDGLKTMSVAVESGDVLVLYNPAITRDWGLAGLAAAVRESESLKPEGIVADIIGAKKDFSGRDTIDSPVQLLVLRKR